MGAPKFYDTGWGWQCNSVQWRHVTDGWQREFCLYGDGNTGTQEGDQTSQRQDGDQPPPLTPEQVQWIDQLISARNEARRGGDQEENSSGAGDPAALLSTVVSQ